MSCDLIFGRREVAECFRRQVMSFCIWLLRGVRPLLRFAEIRICPRYSGDFSMDVVRAS